MTLSEWAAVSLIVQVQLITLAHFSCMAVAHLWLAMHAQNELVRDRLILQFMVTVFVMVCLLRVHQLTLLRLLGYHL